MPNQIKSVCREDKIYMDGINHLNSLSRKPDGDVQGRHEQADGTGWKILNSITHLLQIKTKKVEDTVI